MPKLPLSFYEQDDVLEISRNLLGKFLFTCLEPENCVTGGMIIETEAYRGCNDKASHAYNNRRTKRTEPMYLNGGVAYVYLCYGIHNLFNIITNKKDIPHAILIRAIIPEVGIDLMLKRRHKKELDATLTSGPGALCQALGITRNHNAIDLTGNLIWLEDRQIRVDSIIESPRVGIDYAEEDALKPWRFRINKGA